MDQFVSYIIACKLQSEKNISNSAYTYMYHGQQELQAIDILVNIWFITEIIITEIKM